VEEFERASQRIIMDQIKMKATKRAEAKTCLARRNSTKKIFDNVIFRSGGKAT